MGTLLPKILASVCTSSVHTEHVDWNGKEMVLRDIGFSLTVPPGVIPYRQSVRFAVCLSFSGPFVLPDGCELVSPVYFVSAEPEIQLKKQIKFSLDHWANLDDEESCQSLSFVFAPSDPVSEESQSHFHFRPLPGSVFAPGSQTGTITVDHLSMFAIVRWFRRLFRRNKYMALLLSPQAVENPRQWTSVVSLSLLHPCYKTVG